MYGITGEYVFKIPYFCVVDANKQAKKNQNNKSNNNGKTTNYKFSPQRE